MAGSRLELGSMVNSCSGAPGSSGGSPAPIVIDQVMEQKHDESSTLSPL